MSPHPAFPWLRSVILAVLGLAFGSCNLRAAEVAPSDVGQQAEAYLQAQADAGFFSGAVLIARKGATLYRGAFGWAETETQTPNTPATRFRIASITKTFTAALVLKLIDQEQLALDARLDAYLTPCPESWRRITIHHLLTHTSGIFNYSDLPAFTTLNRISYSTEQIVAMFRGRPLEFEPGEKYRYSNSNYLLLAWIVEQATGRGFADVLQRELLDPLGLNDTGVDSLSNKGVALAHGYQPHGLELVEAPQLDMAWVHGAGAMYSTVADLEKWTQALAEGRVLPATTVSRMWQADKGPYGYGWQVLDSWPSDFGRPLVLHAGGLNGFATDLLHFPQDQVTIVILANLETSPMAVISRDLSAIVFGADYSLPVVRQAVTVDPAILDRYTGSYQLAPGVTINVRRDAGQLVVQVTGQSADIAIPESATRFFSRRTDAQLTFVQEAAGQITHLVLHQNGRDLTAARQP